MLKAIAEHAAKGGSFAFETTLSGLGYARMIPRWRQQGYALKLLFLSLPDAELALVRVAARVAQGGHNTPEAVVRRRFAAGIENFHQRYKQLVDAWLLYDNAPSIPLLIDRGQFAVTAPPIDTPKPEAWREAPDMLAAPIALLRKAKKARLLAEQTGTPYVIRERNEPIKDRESSAG